MAVPRREVIGSAGVLTPRGVERRPLLRHRSGLAYRDGTCDLQTIRECMKNYAAVDCKGRVVLDVGANIGAFSAMALRAGAPRVVAVEPDPRNAAVFRVNAPGAELVEAAAVPGLARTAMLHVPPTPGGPSLASLIPRRGRHAIHVPAANWSELLRRHRPQVLKVDVEGAEYDLLGSAPLPDSVETLAVEWHGFNEAQLRRMDAAIAAFSRSWRVISSSRRKFYGRPCVDAIYRR